MSLFIVDTYVVKIEKRKRAPKWKIMLFLRLFFQDTLFFKWFARAAIQNPEQKSPYASISISSTIEEALNEALRGFLMHWRPEEYKRSTKFVPIEDW